MEEKQNTSPVLRPQRLQLAACRKKTGVSLKEIAESTKINPHFLRAIEAGEYDQLPGGIFSTSYIRQYAAAIGFDERELLAHYRSRSGANPVAVAHPPGTQPPKTWEKKQSILGLFRVRNPIRFF